MKFAALQKTLCPPPPEPGPGGRLIKSRFQKKSQCSKMAMRIRDMGMPSGPPGSAVHFGSIQQPGRPYTPDTPKDAFDRRFESAGKPRQDKKACFAPRRTPKMTSISGYPAARQLRTEYLFLHGTGGVHQDQEGHPSLFIVMGSMQKHQEILGARAAALFPAPKSNRGDAWDVNWG